MPAQPLRQPPEGFHDLLTRAVSVLVESMDLEPGQAVAWLQAYAVATGRPLAEVAGDLVRAKARPLAS